MLLLAIALTAAVLLMVGLYHWSVKELVTSILRGPYQLLERTRGGIRAAGDGLGDRVRAIMTEEHVDSANSAVRGTFTAIAYTLIFAVSVTAEAYFAALWAAHLKLPTLDLQNLPLSAGALVVASLGAAAAFWGMVFFELIGGSSSLGPLPNTRASRISMALFVAVGILLAASTFIALGLDRAVLVNRPPETSGELSGATSDAALDEAISGPEEPERSPLEKRLNKVVLVGQAALMFMTALVSWHGVPALAIFVIAGVMRLAQWLALIALVPFTLLATLWNAASMMLLSALDLALRPLSSLAEPLGRRLGPDRSDSHLPVVRRDRSTERGARDRRDADDANVEPSAGDAYPPDDWPRGPDAEANDDGGDTLATDERRPRDRRARSNNWSPFGVGDSTGE